MFCSLSRDPQRLILGGRQLLFERLHAGRQIVAGSGLILLVKGLVFQVLLVGHASSLSRYDCGRPPALVPLYGGTLARFKGRSRRHRFTRASQLHSVHKSKSVGGILWPPRKALYK